VGGWGAEKPGFFQTTNNKQQITMNLEALFTLHCDIPREGPGSDAATREAIGRLLSKSNQQPKISQVLDVGCGPGKQTLVLAKELQVPVTAVDFHEPYLLRLQQAAAEQGLDRLISTRLENMESLTDPEGSIDLIWAEASIYIIGFANGLKLWRPLLRDRGFVVASEATWLTDHPPTEVLNFWQTEYPAMTNIEGNITLAKEAGYEVFDYFILPQSAWWDEYYTPLAKRIKQLRPQADEMPGLGEVLDDNEREIEICDRFGDTFGYVFYLMRP
jgi:SAM-dependent methyltransferase